MRFVSHSPRLGLGTVFKEKFVLAVDGQRDLMPDTKTGWVGNLPVTFSQDGLTQADVDFALGYWPEKSFTGRWLDADGVTQQNVVERIGVFDTSEHGWTDEIRETVEQWMLAKNNYGIDFVQVTDAPAPAAEAAIVKPWPSYDETHHFKIPTLAAELGLLSEALAYEKATKNRAGVVAALEQASPATVETVAA